MQHARTLSRELTTREQPERCLNVLWSRGDTVTFLPVEFAPVNGPAVHAWAWLRLGIVFSLSCCVESTGTDKRNQSKKAELRVDSGLVYITFIV